MRRLLVLLTTLFTLACGNNPYEGMSMEEVIKAVKTPRQAQEFIDLNIDYDHDRAENPNPTENPSNVGKMRSFRTFFNKGGVCSDGSIAVAAMLQDDGYPSLSLTINCTAPGESAFHQVFVYEENGMWGSAGINASDFSRPKFDSIEDLVDSSVHGCQSYSLMDHSTFDLVEGVNGFVPKNPFIALKVKSGEIKYEAEIEKTLEGYVIQRRSLVSEIIGTDEETGDNITRLTGETSITTRNYSPNLYLTSSSIVRISSEGESVDRIEYTIQRRNEFGRQTDLEWKRTIPYWECRRDCHAPFVRRVITATCEYTYNQQFLESSLCESEIFEDGELKRFARVETESRPECYFQLSEDYINNPAYIALCPSHITTSESNDGDYIIDTTRETEY